MNEANHSRGLVARAAGPLFIQRLPRAEV